MTKTGEREIAKKENVNGGAGLCTYGSSFE